MNIKYNLKTSLSTVALLTALGVSGALEAEDWNKDGSTERRLDHEMTSNTSPIHTGKRSQEYETSESNEQMRDDMGERSEMTYDRANASKNMDEKYSKSYSSTDQNHMDSETRDFDSAGKMTQELFFKFDSTELTEESSEKLSNIVETLESNQMNNVEIEVLGYTDDSGPEVYNDYLSEERAKAVKEKLSEEVDKLNVVDWKVEGKGESNPMADNGTRQGRMENRRVQINISKSPNDRVSQSQF